MTKRTLMVAACATLLSAGTVLATTPSKQENCDKARITAWKTFVSCVDTVVANDAGCMTTGCTASFNEFTAFAKCRHTYFKNWATFQTKSTLTTSTCIGSRFVDNGTTVTDNLSGLVWEKKTGTVGGGTDSNPENVNNSYTWSTGAPWNGTGTAFTTFLTTGLNTPGFAGANDWRLPTLAELHTIVLDFPCPTIFSCTCGASPCIDATFGPTQSSYYWSATSYVPFPDRAWDVYFVLANLGTDTKSNGFYARAVRGGF